ncbi:MAG TPA: hypothetical protein VLH56_18520 [Dissulfurispiraceae bacterium]|nr:hypothetical protein [Dissulfurispiraceae bacterium]
MVNLNPALRALRKSLPGAVVECTWARVTGSTYDPVTGAYVNTTSTVTFSAIKGEYRTFERLAGIQAGDCKLIIDSLSVPAVPPVGAVITWGGVAHEVVDAKDFAGIAYELQMRRK